MDSAPKDGTPFLALNHDLEVWVAKHDSDGRLMFRTHGRCESTRHVLERLADGRTGWVRDDAATTEEWRNDWTLWTRLYDFAPIRWQPLSAPPVTP